MRRSRPLSAILIAVVLALAVPACGGGDDEAETTSAPASKSPFGSGAPPSSRQLPPEFVKCMADQGYDVQPSDDIHSLPTAALQQCFGALHG